MVPESEPGSEPFSECDIETNEEPTFIELKRVEK